MVIRVATTDRIDRRDARRTRVASKVESGIEHDEIAINRGWNGQLTTQKAYVVGPGRQLRISLKE